MRGPSQASRLLPEREHILFAKIYTIESQLLDLISKHVVELR
jgi:hypothetical protein